MPPSPRTTLTDLHAIAEAIHARQRFVISSHSRPDGDSIGSSLAMAYALRALGKHADVMHADPAPAPFAPFPGVGEILVTAAVPDGARYDAAIIMECGDLGRTGVAGLDRFFVINIDHHPGNSGYGNLTWFDPSAAALGEMIFELSAALGVTPTLEIATHVYAAILTDTGSFHYANITPRTFAISKACLEAGVDPVYVSRTVYDSNKVSRLKLFGSILNTMRIDSTGRIAVLYLDHEMASAAGGTYDDTEGLINEPLSVKEMLAVVFFKQIEGDQYRVSMRSKGEVDIAVVAKEHGGGGHRNAAGCTVSGPVDALQKMFVDKIGKAIDGPRKER